MKPRRRPTWNLQLVPTVDLPKFEQELERTRCSTCVQPFDDRAADVAEHEGEIVHVSCMLGLRA